MHFRLAALSLANGNHDQAVDLLKKALVHCDGATEGPPAAHIWFELGDIYTLKGDTEEAAVAFQNSGLEVGDHAAWHAHGKVLDQLVGLPGVGGALRRKALRAMVRAIEMTKDEPEYWHTLAVLHRSMGTFDEAFECVCLCDFQSKYCLKVCVAVSMRRCDADKIAAVWSITHSCTLNGMSVRM